MAIYYGSNRKLVEYVFLVEAMEYPKPESVLIQHAFIRCLLFTCGVKGEEMLLVIAYVNTPPIGRLWKFPKK